MSWETFYFGCFLIGFLFSLVAALSGSAHLHLHLPRGWHAPVGHGSNGGRSAESLACSCRVLISTLYRSKLLAHSSA